MSDQLTQSEREELEQLRSQKNKSIRCQVSTKGAVSLYGLGRFPVTLYKGQWEKLLSFANEIEKFIKDNESKLSVKE
jgi:hypothetical protein